MRLLKLSMSLTSTIFYSTFLNLQILFSQRGTMVVHSKKEWCHTGESDQQSWRQRN
uniref:Uncharacterized protein n=1 Tax=Arundo donax TaxID=35708 RepID=A0A0A9EBS4_ARUDO